MNKLKMMFSCVVIFVLVGFAYSVWANSPELSKPVQRVVDFMTGKDKGVVYAGKSFVDKSTGIRYDQVKSMDSFDDLFAKLSMDEKLNVLNWAKDHSDKFSPIYFCMLAEQLYDVGYDEDEAMILFMIGYIRVATDVKMCKDTTAIEQLAIIPMLAQNLLTATQNKDKKYKSEIMKKAVDWDKSHSRMNPVWSCYHGMATFFESGEPKTLPMSKYEEIQESTRKQFLKN